MFRNLLMPFRTPTKFAIFSSSVILGLGLIQVAVAQSASSTLEEVTVTARKVEERTQDIPLSISAFTSKDLEAAAISNLADVANQTPGLSFNTRGSSYTAGRVDSAIRMRGVASISGLDHLQPVSVFVDGIFVLGTASSLSLQDVERVEVIRGPQSAFFGRNTFAGAINYITKTPSLVNFETKLDLSAAQYQKTDFNLQHSGPLLPGKLGYQVSAREYHRGAEWRATDGGGLGEESSRALSAVLFGQPTDELSFKLRLFWQEDEDGAPVSGAIRGGIDMDTCTGKTFQRLGVNGQPITISPTRYFCGPIPSVNDPRFVLGFSSGTSLHPPELTRQGQNGFNFETGQVLTGPQPNAITEFLLGREFIKGAPALDHFGMLRRQQRASLNVDYNFNSGYALNLLGGWNQSNQNVLRDYDQTDIFAWVGLDPKFSTDWSAEVRLNSPQQQRLRWMIGLTTYEQEFIASANGGLLISPCLPSNCNAGPGIFSTPTGAGNLAEVKSVYGSLSFNITDELSLDIETRYMEDRRTVVQSGFTYSHTFKQSTPRTILRYRPTENINIYGQYSVGALPGVTNGQVASCSEDAFLVPYISPYTGQPTTASECDQLRMALGRDNLPGSTESQELKAFEIGYKQTLLDGRANFALSAWKYEWQGLPASVGVSYVRDAENPALRDRIPNPFPNLLGVSIEGNQDLWGLELQAAYRPTDRLAFTFNAAWSGNEYTKFFASLSPRAGGFSNLKGMETPRYPEWMGNISASFTDRLSGDWDWYVRTDLMYNGDYWADFANLAKAPSWLNTNIRFGALGDGGNTRIELFVRNLFDIDEPESAHVTDNYAIPGNFSFSSNQNLILKPFEKRTVGVRLNWTF